MNFRYIAALMTERHSLVRSTTIIAIATMGSRVLGLVRDTLMAACFGIAVTDPFIIAFRIPNTLRRLFAEGALSAALIPAFSHCLEREGMESAARLGGSLLKVLFFWLVFISVLGILLAPVIVQILPSDPEKPQIDELTIELLRIMFPYILLIGLSAAAMGMLNCMGKFFIPAFSPALLNLGMIGSIVLGVLFVSETAQIRVLAYGVIFGGILQFLVQYFPLRKRMGIGLRQTPLWDPRLAQVLWMMLPLAFGQAITEINVLVDTYFAKTIEGANTYLFFSNRLVQFPLGVFGIALATAAFPRLSRDAVQLENSHQAVADTLVYTLRKILFIMLPSAAGLILVGRDMVGAIFGHGAFQAEGSLHPTYVCTVYYAFGLPAFASVKVVVSAFYARKDAKTPALVGTLAVIANCILDMTLIGPLLYGGLAFATTLASYLNLLLLMSLLGTKIHLPLFRRLAGDVLRGLACCGIMALGVLAVNQILPAASGRFVLYIIRLAVLLSVGGGLYSLSSWYIQREETLIIMEAFTERWKKYSPRAE